MLKDQWKEKIIIIQLKDTYFCAFHMITSFILLNGRSRKQQSLHNLTP